MSEQMVELETRLTNAPTRQAEIDALNDLAWELRYRQTERAFALSEQAYELSNIGEFAAHPYHQGQAASLTTRAYLNRHRGKLDLALDQCFQAMAWLDSSTPTRASIDCLRIISWIYYFLGDHSNALGYGLQALKFSQTTGLKVQEASVLDNLAMIHAASGDADQAMRDHADALSIARAMGDETLESVILNNNATVLLKRGEYTRALESSHASLEIARRLALDEQQVAASDTLGQILQKQGDYARAEQVLTEALRTSIQTQRELGQAYCWLSLGNLYLAQQNLEQATFNFCQSLNVAVKIGARPVQMECHEKLSLVAEQQNDWQQALVHHKAFHEVYKEIHSETSSKRIAVLKIEHQVETAKRDAEIYHLRNEELSHEIEERKRMELALRELAITDPLTRLYNRRHFFSLAERLMEQATRGSCSLSILILDIDNFKHINDTYGHMIGDEVIKFLAASIRRSIRAVDVAARFGGDEFVILLPDTSAPHATLIAERLRLYVAEQNIPVRESHLHLTLSLGIASSSGRKGIGAIDTLLEQADHALYTAKQSGRNQVQSYKS